MVSTVVPLGDVPAGQERFELIFDIILQGVDKSFIHRFEISTSVRTDIICSRFHDLNGTMRVHVASHVRPTRILIEDLGSSDSPLGSQQSVAIAGW